MEGESAASLGDRLRGARRRRLVGRTGEVEVFRSALLAPEDPATVLFLYGPGGVGKTSLLDVLADTAAADGATPVRIDARLVPPTPDGLLSAIATAAGGGDAAALSRLPRPVLLLDTYELLSPLDEWVRTELLPALPGDALGVIAGRLPPAPRWVADPAWRELLRVVSLRNLPPQDGRAYLAAQGVDGALHDKLLTLSHGHPLTLSLLVDAVRRRTAAGAGTVVPRSLADVPDLVRALLAHVLDETPGPRHRAALEVCAHAHATTEHLLRDVLGPPEEPGARDDTAELFAWLRTLSFVEEGPRGLFPHDLARDALDADLRWRDRDRYARLHHRVREHLLTRVRGAASEREKEQLLMDAIFVARSEPALAPYVASLSRTQEYIDELRPGDHAAVIAMTAALQGREQGEIVAHWMRRQPRSFRVFRGPGGHVHGYGGYLALHQATDADLAADPGAAAMWAYAQLHGPPRAGEHVVAWRFFLDRTHHHDPSGSLALVTVWHVLDILTREPVSWTFLGTYSDVERWGPVMTYMDYTRAPEADYEVGGVRYAVFAHDWRRVGVPEWLAHTEAHELGASGRPPQEPAPELVLSQPEFADAVRTALRDLHDAERLARNPLLRSQVVRRHVRNGQPATEALGDLLAAAADTLRADPRQAGLYQVIARTFLRPAATQERAAEALHLSFSTYRRHRDRAVARVVEWMWGREVYGPAAER